MNAMQRDPNWHHQSIDSTLVDLKTTAKGLTENDAQARLREYGSNRLPEPAKRR